MTVARASSLLTDAGKAKLEAGRQRWQALEDEWRELVGDDRLDAMREAIEMYLAADATAPTASPGLASA